MAKGASWIGIDVQQRTIDSIPDWTGRIHAHNPEHPWRQQIEETAQELMLQLTDRNSVASQRLNQGKDAY